MENDGTSGFRVIDRRGQASPEEEAPAKPEPAGEAKAAPDSLPAIDFSTFVLSLATSAFYHLGLVPDPETKQPAPPNLLLARQTIDTLDVLLLKTRGNLDADESRLLESLLYELRLRFVDTPK
jgi:hypothetical protein